MGWGEPTRPHPNGGLVVEVDAAEHLARVEAERDRYRAVLGDIEAGGCSYEEQYGGDVLRGLPRRRRRLVRRLSRSRCARRGVVTCPLCHQPIDPADRTCITDLGAIHATCCVMCTTADQLLADPVYVERVKRGNRRGTPKAWALRGCGG